MNIRADTTFQHGIAVVRLHGNLTAGGWGRVFRKLTVHPDFKPAMPTLWDFREAVGAETLTPGDFGSIASLIRDTRPANRQTRVAMLVGHDVDFGMARMFEMSSRKSIPIDIQVFRDYDAALGWCQGLF